MADDFNPLEILVGIRLLFGLNADAPLVPGLYGDAAVDVLDTESASEVEGDGLLEGLALLRQRWGH